jgi:hypothetical protein
MGIGDADDGRETDLSQIPSYLICCHETTPDTVIPFVAGIMDPIDEIRVEFDAIIQSGYATQNVAIVDAVLKCSTANS